MSLQVHRSVKVFLVKDFGVMLVGIDDIGRMIEAASFRPRVRSSGSGIAILEPRRLWTGEIYEEVTSLILKDVTHVRGR